MGQLWDLLFHLDEHLRELVNAYGVWTYAILFGIIFAETGLVIAPFLPGDSLLFAAGVLTVPDAEGNAPLSLPLLSALLIVAAIIGDTVNYHIGYYVGPRVFKSPKSFWLNPKHLDRTQDFFDRYGGKTIILARFLPIVRTLAPFVAGVGKMAYGRFLVFNVVGAIIWVVTFLALGRLFGDLPVVKKNFELVILAIIGISVLPGIYEFLRHRYARKHAHKPIEQAVEE